MKKTLLLTVLTILLVAGAIYVQASYKNSLAKNPTGNTANESVKNRSASDSSNNPGSQSSPKTRIKVKAPDFKLTDLNGKEVSLSDFKGKNVFLNFWASWCPPCKAEMPDIEKLYQETKNTDLVILGVDLGENKLTVKSFVAANHYNYRFLLDTDQQAALKYNISSIPSSFFIDKDGNIAATHIGYMDMNQMKSYVEQLENK